MKKIVPVAISIALLLSLGGCSSSPEDTLKSSLNKYMKCTMDGDFKCVAKYTDQKLVNTMGGIDGFEKTMASSGLSIANITIKNIGKMQKDGNTLSSKIIISETAEMNGNKMSIPELTITATSKDNGKTWYFRSEQ